jgi:uncharacterized protein YqcC (DUF446 family)
MLLQKILSYKNQVEMENLVLPQVFKIAKTNHNTMLSCSAVMFVTAAFDIYKADLYRLKEDLINEIVIKQSLVNVKKVLPGGEEENQHFSTQVIVSILDSYVILMKSIFNQLFTPEQLTEILSVFFSIPEEKGLNEANINNQIDTITSLISKHVNPQISLHALFNIFDFIAVNPQHYCSTEEKLNLYCTRYFEAMMKIFRNIKKEFIDEYNQGIFKFLQKAFLIPQTWSKSTNLAMDSSTIHSVVLATFKTFILKLNETQLKPLFQSLIKWASKKTPVPRLFIFFKATNTLLSTLMSIFVPFLPLYFPLLCNTFSDALSPTEEAISMVNALLECIRLNYYFDGESTIPAEYFQKVSDSMLFSFDFFMEHKLMSKEEYLKWVKEIYQKTVVDVLDALDNAEATREFLEELMKKTKHQKATVRLAALRVLQGLVDKFEEKFLVFLNDLLPFISEAFEDQNEEVEETARNIIQKIEGMTGESIQQYLK